MAVRVAGDVRRKIRKYPGAIVIQVQRCSDAEAAAAALTQAAAEIAALDGGWESAPGLEPGETVGPKFVSNVAKLPTGPFLWLDGGHTPDDLLATIPDIVARHLADAGVGTATIAFPETRAPLYDENGLAVGRPRRAAVLCLYPPPVWRPGSVRGRAPASWIEEAAAWVQGDLGPDDPMWAMVVSLALPITAGDGVALLQQARRAGSGCLVAGDLEARARVAQGMFIGVDRIGLGAGGPVTTDEELLADFERLRAIARRLAPTMAYAFVAIMPYLGSSNLLTDAQGEDGGDTLVQHG